MRKPAKHAHRKTQPTTTANLRLRSAFFNQAQNIFNQMFHETFDAFLQDDDPFGFLASENSENLESPNKKQRLSDPSVVNNPSAIFVKPAPIVRKLTMDYYYWNNERMILQEAEKNGFTLKNVSEFSYLINNSYKVIPLFKQKQFAKVCFDPVNKFKFAHQILQTISTELNIQLDTILAFRSLRDFQTYLALHSKSNIVNKF